MGFWDDLKNIGRKIEHGASEALDAAENVAGTAYRDVKHGAEVVYGDIKDAVRSVGSTAEHVVVKTTDAAADLPKDILDTGKSLLSSPIVWVGIAIAAVVIIKLK